MRKLFQTIVFSVFVFSTVAVIAQPFRSSITGRVVDERGIPVAGANIRAHSSEELKAKQCGVKENSVFTDFDGRFLHQEHCGVPNRTISLSMAPPLTSFGYVQTPIYPPFWDNLRKSDKRFAGLEFRLEGNESIDVGNVPLQISYNGIELVISDASGKPYYRSEDDWAKFVLIVRDGNGLAVGSEGLSIMDIKKSVLIDRGAVKLALPEGTWALELLKDWNDFDASGKTLKHLAMTSVTVPKAGGFLRARLVVRR